MYYDIDVESSHDVKKGQYADDVNSVFQSVNLDNCNVKVVINSTNCDNMGITQLLLKFLLFASDVISLELI